AAQKLARARDQPEVTLEHLLMALCEAPESAALVRAAGADPAAVRAGLEAAVARLPRVVGEGVYLGADVLRLLDIAQIDARERGAPGRRSVEPAHLLLGVPLETRSPAAAALREAGATLPKLEAAVGRAGASAPVSASALGENGASAFPVLERYA